MKKWISILILSIYLVSTTELTEVLKLPQLLEHYKEHHQLNAEMSLLAFFNAHYSHPVSDADYSKDQKLPFVIHSARLILFFTLAERFYFDAKHEIFRQIKSHKIASQNENLCYKGFLNSVWDPPRYS